MSTRQTITGHTKVLCVIGHPIEHSMSPTMHNAAIHDLGLDYVYVAYDVHPNSLEKAVQGFKALEIVGINVTIPHKENIMKYMDEIDPMAKNIGAVNTIKNDKGHFVARNTDAAGGKKALIDGGCEISGKRILFLGSGGVARALAFILAEEAEKVVLTDIDEKKAISLASEGSRYFKNKFETKKSTENVLQAETKKADVLINATPIGMFPNINASPLPKHFLHPELFVFDVVYNPLKTRLIKEAEDLGCKALGGLDMLINQGALAFEWWTGKTPNTKLMKSKIIDFLGIKV